MLTSRDAPAASRRSSSPFSPLNLSSATFPPLSRLPRASRSRLHWQGGPSRAAAPALEIAYNRIYNYGQGIISDLGGVYISSASDKVAATNWLAADVHHNWISNASSYTGGYGANGLYNDHGTSGVHFHSNIVERVGGRGGSLHCGRGLSFVNNVIYDVARDPWTSSNNDDGALSSCNGDDVADPGFAANVSINIIQPIGTRDAWALKDTTWKPPTCTVTGDRNVFWAGAAGAMAFPPAGGALAEWRTLTGADGRSVEADPLLRDPARGDFSPLPNSPVWALGWVAIDQAGIGVIPL